MYYYPSVSSRAPNRGAASQAAASRLIWAPPGGPGDWQSDIRAKARTSFRLTPAPPTPRPSASPPHTRPRRSPEDALPPCQAPAPAPAAAGGLLRRIFPRERQRDIRRVLLLIHLEVRLGSPEPLEHPLFLDPIQKIIGILRIQRLACLQRPDARDLRLAVQIQPHDGQLAHRIFRAGLDVHRHVHGLLRIVDAALARHLRVQVSGAPHGLANLLQPLVHAFEIGHVAGLEIAGLDQHGAVYRARP